MLLKIGMLRIGIRYKQIDDASSAMGSLFVTERHINFHQMLSLIKMS
jgi:hypothetical protein